MFHNSHPAWYAHAKRAGVRPEADASPRPGTPGPLPSPGMDRRAQLGWLLLFTTLILGIIAYRLYEIAEQDAASAARVAQFERAILETRGDHEAAARIDTNPDPNYLPVFAVIALAGVTALGALATTLGPTPQHHKGGPRNPAPPHP